jgi:hypothetical protein
VVIDCDEAARSIPTQYWSAGLVSRLTRLAVTDVLSQRKEAGMVAVTSPVMELPPSVQLARIHDRSIA